MGMPKDLIKLLTNWLILFNLFMRPLLKTVNGLAYADDSHHSGHSRNNQQALEMLQEKINTAEKWIRDSNVKVNLDKTEVCIFHRTDTREQS